MRLTLIAMWLVATWPVGPWMWSRTAPISEKLLGLFTIGSAIGLLLLRGRSETAGSSRATRPVPVLVWPTLLALAYCAAFARLPELAVAMIAMIGLATTLHVCSRGDGKLLPLTGLLLLALPMIDRLQFYLGYPLRVIVGRLASTMLQTMGYAVATEGAVLNWQSRIIAIDAPCSGVKMLWAAGYLTFALAMLWGLSNLQTLLAGILVLILVIVGNSFRTASLFFVETRPESFPAWMHSAIGMAAFGFTAVLIWLVLNWRFRPDNLRPSEQPIPSSANEANVWPSRSWLIGFSMCCCLAAIGPLMSSSPQTTSLDAFSGWPPEFSDPKFQAVRLTKHESAFAESLPGRLGKFTDGRRQFLVQWIAEGSRLVHSSTDCLTKAGYTVKPDPIRIDSFGNRWAAYQATRQGQSYHIMERLYDDSGHEWHDVSTWYWAVLRQKTRGPWWMVTVIEPID